jgi:glycosyltransferase involved in cell wall biosynthesis
MLGGVERYVVTLANHLPRDAWDVHLCTTRVEGPLARDVAPDVHRLHLARRVAFDPFAMRRLALYVRRNRIRLLHAHGSALYLAAATAAAMRPRPPLLWHDHYGDFEVKRRSTWLHRLATLPVDGIVSVTEDLARWAREVLRFPGERVWYLRNFVAEPPPLPAPELPGVRGRRIVCVANLRPLKAQHDLVKAMAVVAREHPDARLLLVGNENDPEYARQVRETIVRERVEGNVTVLGPRTDVPAILQACDIGVVSSHSEGLPMALIEYGMAHLAAVATAVGQCADVLDAGRAGVVVPPREPQKLAEALIALLTDDTRRRRLADALTRRVHDGFGPGAGVKRFCEIYRTVLDSRR